MDKGMLDVNTEKAAEIFRDGQKTNGWEGARRDLYDKMIHPEVREAMAEEMDLLVRKIYAINKPETRRVTLTPVK